MEELELLKTRILFLEKQIENLEKELLQIKNKETVWETIE